MRLKKKSPVRGGMSQGALRERKVKKKGGKAEISEKWGEKEGAKGKKKKLAGYTPTKNVRKDYCQRGVDRGEKREKGRERLVKEAGGGGTSLRKLARDGPDARGEKKKSTRKGRVLKVWQHHSSGIFHQLQRLVRGGFG